MKADEVRGLMKNPYEEIMDKIKKAATAIKPKRFIEVGNLSSELIERLEDDGFNIVHLTDGFTTDVTGYKISW